MEKTILKYLEFLLPIHNCVIIPDFGGFIINIEDSASDSRGRLTPPVYNIVFNPELNYNDGILASYIIKDDKISYNAACNKIKDSVKSIKYDLRLGKTVQCSNIGLLSIDENGNIIFSSNRKNIYPALYGLYETNIQPLEEINKAFYKEKRYLSLRYIAGGIAAAVVSLFLFLGPETDIKDNNHIRPQESSFISSLSTSTRSSAIKENAVEYEKVENIDMDDYPVSEEWTSTTKNTFHSNHRYFIIIGGEQTMHKANMLLDRFRESDFPEAALVASPDRIRIYVKSFEDKTEAERFLLQFRLENPLYESAWLYSK